MIQTPVLYIKVLLELNLSGASYSLQLPQRLSVELIPNKGEDDSFTSYLSTDNIGLCL